MNVLLVVPFHKDLALLPAEAEGVINQLQPRRVLQGNVDEARLSATIQADLREGGPYAGVWIATHSSERAVMLSGGQLDKDAFVQYMALSGAKWVVLNGCEGEGLAAALTSIGMDVITTALTSDGRGVKDRDAWRMATLLANALEAHDGDLRDAYDSIPNASRIYGFFPASDVSRSFRSEESAMYQLLYEVRSEVAKLSGRTDTLTARIDSLEISMRTVSENSSRHVTPIGAIFITCVVCALFLMIQIGMLVQMHGGISFR